MLPVPTKFVPAASVYQLYVEPPGPPEAVKVAVEPEQIVAPLELGEEIGFTVTLSVAQAVVFVQEVLPILLT